MPKCVRVHPLDAGSLTPFANCARYRALIDSHFPRRKKNRPRAFRLSLPMALIVRSIGQQRINRLLTKRTDARLVAFPCNRDFALSIVDVLPVGAAEL